MKVKKLVNFNGSNEMVVGTVIQVDEVNSRYVVEFERNGVVFHGLWIFIDCEDVAEDEKVEVKDGGETGLDEANDNLIAAAPLMLKALES